VLENKRCTRDFTVYEFMEDKMCFRYSIVKDSSADLGVNSKIVQIRPTVKAVCTKMSKIFFCIFVNILIFLNESREDHFEYFEYLRKTALY